MNSHEMGAPDPELVRRFDSFVAGNLGHHALGNSQVILEAFELPDSSDWAHVIQVTEPVEGPRETHELITIFDSRNGKVTKFVNMQTAAERAATERLRAESRLETEVEMVLSDVDMETANDMILRRLLSEPGAADILAAALNKEDDAQQADAIEVSDLLDRLEAGIGND